MLSKTALNLEKWAADAAQAWCGSLVVVREAKAEEGKLVRTNKHGAPFLVMAPDGAARFVPRSFVVAPAKSRQPAAWRKLHVPHITIKPHRGGPLVAVVQHNKALKAFASLTGTLRCFAAPRPLAQR